MLKVELIRPEYRDQVLRNFQATLAGQNVPPYEITCGTAACGD